MNITALCALCDTRRCAFFEGSVLVSQALEFRLQVCVGHGFSKLIEICDVTEQYIGSDLPAQTFRKSLPQPYQAPYRCRNSQNGSRSSTSQRGRDRGWQAPMDPLFASSTILTSHGTPTPPHRTPRY